MNRKLTQLEETWKVVYCLLFSIKHVMLMEEYAGAGGRIKDLLLKVSEPATYAHEMLRMLFLEDTDPRTDDELNQHTTIDIDTYLPDFMKIFDGDVEKIKQLGEIFISSSHQMKLEHIKKLDNDQLSKLMLLAQAVIRKNWDEQFADSEKEERYDLAQRLLIPLFGFLGCDFSGIRNRIKIRDAALKMFPKTFAMLNSEVEEGDAQVNPSAPIEPQSSTSSRRKRKGSQKVTAKDVASDADSAQDSSLSSTEYDFGVSD